MRALLDTHVFLWWVNGAPDTSEAARDAIRNPENEMLLSPVSGWEIVIKAALGRLALSGSPAQFVPRQVHQNDFGILPVSMQHALEVYHLPPHHQDPFDRLLVAQARSEDIPLISGDSAIHAYDVKILW